MAPDQAVQTNAGTRLIVEGLSVSYGRRQALYDVSLQIEPGEILSVLGHNGAGKSTLLKGIFGLVRSSGSITVGGHVSTHPLTVESVRYGISFTPAETPIFRDLTVKENLLLGAYSITDVKRRDALLARVHDLFPVLAEREDSIAGQFSGGQQRMLAIGIALMSAPRLMLLDEPSLGIAPGLVADIFKRIRQLCDEEGLAVLLVEQNVRAALTIADRTAFLRNGSIILEESAEASRAREHWWDLF